MISGKKAKLFNPNKHKWAENFTWSKDKTQVIGKTLCGRATIYALKMNDDLQTNARKVWKLTGFFPPKD